MVGLTNYLGAKTGMINTQKYYSGGGVDRPKSRAGQLPAPRGDTPRLDTPRHKFVSCTD